MGATDEARAAAATFARRIAQERKRRGLSLRDVGAAAGISASQVLRAEQGTGRDGISLRSALQIAAALKMSVDGLLKAPECAWCDDAPPSGFICGYCRKGGK